MQFKRSMPRDVAITFVSARGSTITPLKRIYSIVRYFDDIILDTSQQLVDVNSGSVYAFKVTLPIMKILYCESILGKPNPNGSVEYLLVYLSEDDNLAWTTIDAYHNIGPVYIIATKVHQASVLVRGNSIFVIYTHDEEIILRCYDDNFASLRARVSVGCMKVQEIHLFAFGRTLFLALVASDGILQLYIVDPFALPHPMFIGLDAVTPVKHVAVANGKLYYVTTNDHLYCWSCAGESKLGVVEMVNCMNTLFLCATIRTVQPRDNPGCHTMTQSAFSTVIKVRRYCTLEQYIAYLEGRAYRYIEML